MGLSEVEESREESEMRWVGGEASRSECRSACPWESEGSMYLDRDCVEVLRKVASGGSCLRLRPSISPLLYRRWEDCRGW